MEQLIINQGDYGGLAVKPTTFANNLGMEPSTPRKYQVVKAGVQSSKELSRWAPGAMNMVASVALREVLKRPVKIKTLSWQEHLAFNHIPFRRDCYICQQAQQKQLPHRKIKNPFRCLITRHQWPILQGHGLGRTCEVHLGWSPDMGHSSKDRQT